MFIVTRELAVRASDFNARMGKSSYAFRIPAMECPRTFVVAESLRRSESVYRECVNV
jgi:hypothetical protein